MFRHGPRAMAVIASFLIILPVLANLKKAFEALEVHNYFLARELFLKHTRKWPEAAYYGLSVISGRDNNPFYDLDSAHVFIIRADVAFTLADDKRRRKLEKYRVDHEAITEQKRHVYEKAWEIAAKENTIAAYERYIGTYTDSHRRSDAIAARDALAFERAREVNTSAAYLEFIEKYPHAREVYEARSRAQEAVYRENTVEGDLRSYVEFIRRHPDNPYVQEAEDRIYRLSTPGRTAEQYERFIKEHPKNHRVPDAWRSIYEIRTRDLSVNAITRFLTDYPDYPFVEELADDYRTASLKLIPYRENGLWGFIDDQGTVQIEAQYEWVEPFKGAQALVGRNGKVGTINRSGREVIPVIYDEVLEPVETTSTVEADGKVGALDRNGNVVVPVEYEDVGEFSQKLAYAAKDGLYGYVDMDGNEVIPFRFLSAGNFKNGLAVVEMDSGWGVIDRNGNTVVPAEYEWVEGFEREVSRVRLNDLFGLISPFGDELMPVKYDHIGPFKDGLALVVDGRKSGYVDMTGKVAIPFVYEAPPTVANWGDMVNGLAEVQLGGKRCLIDTANRKVFPCQFADIGAATGAIIPFRKRTKWGYADRKGTILFDNRYEQAWEMIGGLAKVKNGAVMGAIDSTGAEVVPLRFLALSDPQHGMVIATDEHGTGVLDVQGRQVVPLIYDQATVVNADLARVEREGRSAYVRLADGSFIWQEKGFQVPEQEAAPVSPE